MKAKRREKTKKRKNRKYPMSGRSVFKLVDIISKPKK